MNFNKFCYTLTLTVALIMLFMSAFGMLNTKNIVTAEQPQSVYIVEENDTLWLVAYKLHSYFPSDDINQIIYDIRERNNIDDPASLQVGQELLLPEAEYE